MEHPREASMANRDHDEKGEAKAADGVSLFVRVTMYRVLRSLVCLVACPDGPHVRHW
jgi:hypothetical protein